MFCGSSCAQTTSSRFGYEPTSAPRRLLRERVELLDPRDRDRVGAGAQLVPDDVVVDLPGAEDEPVHALLVGARVVEHRLERALGEIGEGRGRLAQAQQALRRHHDQRPRDRLERLPAQHVEVLRGGRRVDDADVLLGGRLEEPLEPRARVLRPVALVAVREQERQP